MNYADRNKLGKIAEDRAALYYIEMGYLILKRNYRLQNGEIDIIAKGLDEIVFVEVRSRTGVELGSPSETIDRRKIMRIRKTAVRYLYETAQSSMVCRFDFIGVIFNDLGQIIDIEHIPEAF